MRDGIRFFQKDESVVQLPTADEINVYGSPDEDSACEHFLGKTLPQAEALFRENSLYYLEDLLWMGPKAFCFYVLAAIAYLKSPAAEEDSDAVNSFHGILEIRLDDDRGKISPSFPHLRDALQYILDHWDRFDVDPSIYGDLREKYEALRERLNT